MRCEKRPTIDGDSPGACEERRRTQVSGLLSCPNSADQALAFSIEASISELNQSLVLVRRHYEAGLCHYATTQTILLRYFTTLISNVCLVALSDLLVAIDRVISCVPAVRNS